MSNATCKDEPPRHQGTKVESGFGLGANGIKSIPLTYTWCPLSKHLVPWCLGGSSQLNLSVLVVQDPCCAPPSARRFANASKYARLFGFAIESGLATLLMLCPSNSFLIGSSSFLPDSVRGTSSI
jgi:hypothetical protein